VEFHNIILQIGEPRLSQ